MGPISKSSFDPRWTMCLTVTMCLTLTHTQFSFIILFSQGRNKASIPGCPCGKEMSYHTSTCFSPIYNICLEFPFIQVRLFFSWIEIYTIILMFLLLDWNILTSIYYNTSIKYQETKSVIIIFYVSPFIFFSMYVVLILKDSTRVEENRWSLSISFSNIFFSN